jgi:1-acyl-sn-glycerol-3-phosphate acyltransferase
MQRAGKWQQLLIMSRSLWATLDISLRVILWIYSRRYKRERADNLVRSWSAKLFKIMHTDYTIHNPHHVSFNENTPYIIMSNHASHYDIPLLFLSFPGSLRMIAKKELFRVPIWGHALKISEFVSIDRQNKQQAIRELEKAKHVMKSGILLWVAPEGGRTRDGKLRPFKKGPFMLALQTDAIIVPVGLRGTRAMLPADSWDFHPRQHLEVHIGQPIAASTFGVERRDQLIAHVRSEIQRLAAIESHDE